MEQEDEEWIPLVGGAFTKEDEFCVSIRRLQKRTGCSDAACHDMVKTFRKYLRMDVPSFNLKGTDKKMREAAGTEVLRLNGCIGCHKVVFLPDGKAKVCPRCAHSRYDSKGHPWEEVFYFPLKPKLKSLLRLPAYRKMCEHEFDRLRLKKGEHLMSDVYDSPAWKDFMGPPTTPPRRIGRSCD